jgi:hypothetical protein
MRKYRSIVRALVTSLLVSTFAAFGLAQEALPDVLSFDLALIPVGQGRLAQSLLSERPELTQPLATLPDELSSGWSTPAGDFEFTIDWAKGRWANLPVGVQLGVVCPVFEQPIRFFVSPQYNLKDAPGTDRFKVMVGIALVAWGSDTTKR